MVQKVNINSTGSSNIITAKDLIEPTSPSSNQFDKLDKYLKLADKGLEYIDRIDGLLVKLGIKKKSEQHQQQQQCKPQVIEKEVVVKKPVEKVITPNIDADMIIKGFEKIMELVGDVKLSELIEYIKNNKEQVNNLIKQGMGIVKNENEE